MPRPISVRRLGLTIAGLAAAAAVCVGCSSTTVGQPHTASSAAGSIPSVGAPSVSLSVPSLPSASLPGALTSGVPSLTLPSGLPTPGSSGSPFCKEFNVNDLSNIASASDYHRVISTWDKLTADAPADIKPDFQKVDDYLHSAVSGQAPSNPADLATAARDIGVWYVSNCSG